MHEMFVQGTGDRDNRVQVQEENLESHWKAIGQDGRIGR